jgi:hypothetical protein
MSIWVEFITCIYFQPERLVLLPISHHFQLYTLHNYNYIFSYSHYYGFRV